MFKEGGTVRERNIILQESYDLHAYLMVHSFQAGCNDPYFRGLTSKTIVEASILKDKVPKKLSFRTLRGERSYCPIPLSLGLFGLLRHLDLPCRFTA